KYASRHNPLSYLSDVVNDPAQVTNLVPFSQFAADLANNALPNYAFIVPNLCDDAHDCPLATADAWLQTNIDPLITSPGFQQDGLLIILFDESGGDLQHGGGRIAWVVVSAKVKPGYRSAALYQHENTLRLAAEALGLTTFPNAAAGAANMARSFWRRTPGRRAASGRRRAREKRGSPSLILFGPCRPSAPSRWHHRTPTSSMSAAATTIPSSTAWAMGCISPPMPDAPGVTSGSNAPSRSLPSSWTRTIRTSSWSPHWANSGRRATRVACFAPPTAEPPGPRHCTSTTKPASQPSRVRQMRPTSSLPL